MFTILPFAPPSVARINNAPFVGLYSCILRLAIASGLNPVNIPNRAALDADRVLKSFDFVLLANPTNSSVKTVLSGFIASGVSFFGGSRRPNIFSLTSVSAALSGKNFLASTLSSKNLLNSCPIVLRAIIGPFTLTASPNSAVGPNIFAIGVTPFSSGIYIEIADPGTSAISLK